MIELRKGGQYRWWIVDIQNPLWNQMSRWVSSKVKVAMARRYVQWEEGTNFWLVERFKETYMVEDQEL